MESSSIFIIFRIDVALLLSFSSFLPSLLLRKIIFMFNIEIHFYLGVFSYFLLSRMFVLFLLLTRTIDVIEMFRWTNQMQTAYSSISPRENTYVLIQLSSFEINTSLILLYLHSIANCALRKNEDIQYSSAHCYCCVYIDFRR